jgi:hypothetical protein
LSSARFQALLRPEDVVDLVLRHPVAVERPFEVVDRPLLRAALAGEVLKVEEGADVFGHAALPFGDIGAIADRRRIENAGDVALRLERVAEVLAGRERAVVRRA